MTNVLVNIIDDTYSEYVDRLINIAQERSTNEETYKHNIYSIVGDVLHSNGNGKIVYDKIMNGNWGDKHDSYKEITYKLEEQDSFIEHPFEVEEGVLECTNFLKDGTMCNSKRVYYYQIQTRSSDEPMTTFATCCQCNHNWSYSG